MKERVAGPGAGKKGGDAEGRGDASKAAKYRKAIAELRQIPAVVHLRELMAKVRSGTATAAERDEYEARTKRAREFDPSVLVD